MASPSSSFVQQKNQVYMHFSAGNPDFGAVSRLQMALRRRGINTCTDDQLKKGGEYSQTFLTAVAESKISIIVLSQNFASSFWCLEGLCKILECKNRYGQIVVPIFYHVDPFLVRKQTGVFADAFAIYEERFKHDTDMVERWRAALFEVSYLSGCHLWRASREAKVIEDVVEYICGELNSKRPVQRKDQVFLSSSEETRNNFTSHLDAALRRKGIDTFPDNKLKRGEEISQDLLRAIEESKISIVILSKNYASSTRCLDELSKIHECKERHKQIMVVPIFYNVNPHYVRLRKWSFKEAFAETEKRYTYDIVKRWRAALSEVANLHGHYLSGDELEAEAIQDIVKSIWMNLYGGFSNHFKGLVGMESRIEELKSLLDGMKSDGVRIIGLWGMLGVGTTTTANVLFKHISSQFDASYFLADVREESMSKGLQCVRNELLSKVLKTDVSLDTPSIKGTFLGHWLGRIKVLIVLDDVSNSKQVEYLIGDGSCFGPGSIIVITSRDKGALSAIAGDKIYMVEKLPFDQALELFCQNASRGGCDIPVKEDPNLKGVVRYADGIPLALKILGDFLCGNREEVWKAAARSLYSEIKKELRISYDELENNERNIFLDVACFFEGEDRNHVTSILEGCDFSAETGMIVLINKSLISILNNNLQMNNLIQEMGREIVREESKHPGCRSRLWTYNDIEYILTTDKGTKTVEGIFLNMSEIEEPMCINHEAFLQMDCLRLLKIYSPHSQEDYIVKLPDGFQIHSNKLAYLHWHCCPWKSWPLNFCPKNLVELHMHYSHVIRLWEGTQKLSYLKWIDLSYSKCLEEIPDLSKAQNLERINLVGCTRLQIPLMAPPLDSLPQLQAVYLSG